jgi:hypothetical protein
MHTTPSSRRSLHVGTMPSVSHCIHLRSTGGSHPTWPSARASASRAALSGTKTRETFRMARTTQRRSFTSWSMWMARVLRLAGSHRLVCTHRMTLSNEHSMKAAAACTLGCAITAMTLTTASPVQGLVMVHCCDAHSSTAARVAPPPLRKPSP